MNSAHSRRMHDAWRFGDTHINLEEAGPQITKDKCPLRPLLNHYSQGTGNGRAFSCILLRPMG